MFTTECLGLGLGLRLVSGQWSVSGYALVFVLLSTVLIPFLSHSQCT